MGIRTTDRRQSDIFVENDRRSGLDRRERANMACDTSVFTALEIIPTFRRVASIPDKINNGDTTTALGMTSLALINLPEDLRDVKGVINQFKGAQPKYDYKNYQHNFSFFRGTAIEKWLHKHVDAGKQWVKWLYNNDEVLADTSFGEKIFKIVKANEDDLISTAIKDFNGLSVSAISCKGSLFAKLTSRALRRTTKLGVIAMCLLELPKIIKSIKKNEIIKQTAKSTINVASITAGIGYCGAIGAKYGGGIGSLVGMGLGAVVGSKISNNIQDFI